MAKATTYSNDVLDQAYNGGPSGSVVIGSTTYTLPFKVIFLSTVSTAAAQGTEWATSGGYTHSAAGAVGGVSLSGNFGTAAASASKANTVAITVSNAPAQTWIGNEIVDSNATTNKRMNWATITSKTVNAGDTCTIAIGSLTATEG
jgi:hypothetical protein